MTGRRRTEALLGVAAFTALIGVAVIAAVIHDAWAVDADRNLAAARDLVAGRFGADHGYVYSPLAALLTVPWTWLPQGAAVGAWFALRMAVLLVGVAFATRGWPTQDRILTGIASAFFVPVAYDLLLGNVSILLAVSVAVVAWRRDDWRTGIVLGLALATIPKPQLVPVLLWMLFYRRQALLAAIVTAALATVATAALTGTEPYQAWVGVLRSVDYLSSPMLGNRSLFAVVSPPLGAILAVVATAATLASLARSSLAGLVACIVLGMLVAPYTLAYAPVLLLVVARPIADRMPRLALAEAMTASVGVILAMPLWLAGVLALTLGLRGDPAVDGSAPEPAAQPMPVSSVPAT
jgi:hypothetical protein